MYHHASLPWTNFFTVTVKEENHTYSAGMIIKHMNREKSRHKRGNGNIEKKKTTEGEGVRGVGEGEGLSVYH
jgi:hypothetical protein